MINIDYLLLQALQMFGDKKGVCKRIQNEAPN